MAKLPLSWSRISDFRQCPFKFHEKYIAKTYPDESNNPAFAKGNEVHKQLETYIKQGTKRSEEKLGVIAKAGKPLADALFMDGGEVHAEMQLAVKEDWSPIDWFAKDIMFRAIIDVLHIKDGVATIIDWKTGKEAKYTDNRGQLHLSAAFVFELFPDVQTITSALAFLEHKKSHKYSFARETHAKNRVAWMIEYELINAEDEYAPKKNQYCHWCLSKTCPLKK